ncbi:MAG: hypothetical protein ABW022_11610 [Actinoplanes sp.]
MDIGEAIEAAVVMGIRDAAALRLDPTRRALEVAAHVSLVTCLRPYRVDGAELVGFIKNNDPLGDAEADDLAAAIVERFNLESY